MKDLVTCHPCCGWFGLLITTQARRSRMANVTRLKTMKIVLADELIEFDTKYEGWMICDHTSTVSLGQTGKQGLLKAAVKGSIGVGNWGSVRCQQLGILITKTLDIKAAVQWAVVSTSELALGKSPDLIQGPAAKVDSKNAKRWADDKLNILNTLSIKSFTALSEARLDFPPGISLNIAKIGARKSYLFNFSNRGL